MAVSMSIHVSANGTVFFLCLSNIPTIYIYIYIYTHTHTYVPQLLYSSLLVDFELVSVSWLL